MASGLVLGRATPGRSSSPTVDVTALAPLDSEAPNAHAPTVPDGDFTQPPGEAGLSGLPPGPMDEGGSPGKIISRDETSTVYANGDGTSTVRLHRSQVNWRDRYGVWRAIDPRLQRRADGDWENRSGPASIRMAGAVGDRDLVRLGGDGWAVGFRPVGMAAGRPAQIERSTARYKEVGPAVDLIEEAGADRVKETIQLNRPLPPGTPNSWRFMLSLDNARPEQLPDGGVRFVADDGSELVVMPPGLATDSSSAIDDKGLTARAPVATTLKKLGERWAVDVSVDRAWLDDPARVYPVFVDPTSVITAGFNPGRNSGGWDAFVGSGCGNCNYNGNNQIEANAYTDRIGYTSYNGGWWEFYSYLKWDLSAIMRHSVVSARLKGRVYGANAYPSSFRMYPVSSTWADNTITWSNKAGHRSDYIDVGVPNADYSLNVDIKTWMTNWLNSSWGSHGITMDTAGVNKYVRLAAMEQAWQGVEPYVEVVINDTIVSPGQADQSPADGSTIMTTTPTLSSPPVTDPEGDAVQYWFRMATSDGGEKGQTINSGWLNSPSFNVPPGSLQDGVTYHWKIFTRDRWTDTTPRYSSWPPATLKVDLRLGGGEPSPYDTMGPVSVNLANGNVSLTTSGPEFEAAGGSLGASFSYNSNAPSPYGLTASYYSCGGSSPVIPAEPVLVRRDAAIDFDWGNSSPAPGIVAADGFCVRWNGFITVPRTNRFCFQAERDDGIVIRVNDVTLVDSWVDQGTTSPPWGTPNECIDLYSGRKNRIEVLHYDNGVGARARLWVGGPVGPFVVPSDWLSPTALVMPQGWSVSGGEVDVAYTEARVHSNSVVLVDVEGSTTTYSADSTGTGWIPQNGADGVLSSFVDPATNKANYVLQDEDGLTYTFNEKGKLSSVLSAVDSVNPVAPRRTYGADTGKLASITDPLTNRAVTFSYAAPNGADPADPCYNAPAPFVEAPTGMLCRVSYWDGTATNLYYDAAGRLVRIVDPGNNVPGADDAPEVTDFAYEASGRLSTVREPDAADKVATDPTVYDSAVNGPKTRTAITYANGKATAVQLPVPNVGMPSEQPRPQHSYRYVSAAETQIDVPGFATPEPSFVRRVRFDAGGRLTSDTDVVGNEAVQKWDSDDRLLWTTSSAQDADVARTVAMVYDHAGRVVDNYGPAPAPCIAGQLPTNPLPASCKDASGNSIVPRTTTRYDEGFRGLAAAYWDNETFLGPARAYTTGVGEPTGSLLAAWSTGAPPGLTSMDGYAGRFTGEITFPASGYKLRTCGNDGTRAWIGDSQVIDAWTLIGCKDSTWTSPDNKPQRIRVEVHEATGSSDIGLYWAPPNTTTFSVVPGSALAPRYGLPTSVTDADGRTTATEYARPELGLVTANVVDPAGLKLRTTMSHEAPTTDGSQFSRQLTRTLPGGRDTYRGTVSADAPVAHWRLGETSATALDISGYGMDATYSGVTQGVGGVLTGDGDKAAAFAGTGNIRMPDRLVANGSTMTFEAWFSTTSAGPILGVGNAAAGTTPGNFVPMLYVGNDGKLRGEAWMGSVTPIATSQAVNDGQRHHVALVVAATTQTLYLDGVAVGTLSGTVNHLDMNFTYIGASHTSTSWPQSNTVSGWRSFNGTIDEVAVYRTAVPAARIAAHVQAGTTAPAVTVLTYYPKGTFVTVPCPGGTSVDQGGRLHKALNVVAADGTSLTEETVYDNLGNEVATRTGNDPWTCSTFDARGRAVRTVTPAFGGEPGRTVTTDYAVNSDPFVTAIHDPAGWIISTSDWLGRDISYTDVWGNTTTSSYDRVGRLIESNGPLGTLQTTYDALGRVADQKSRGVSLATPTYNARSEATSVAYANGTSLASIQRDRSGNTIGLTWTRPDGSTLASDAVTRSVGGVVVDQVVDGADANPAGANYTYDTAERLVDAFVGGHHVTYGFDTPTTGCPTGAVATAGRNSNRTSMTDNGGPSATYCYDAADRMLSTTDARYAGPVTYDSHGNTTALGGSTMTYDGSDRHQSSTTPEVSVRYARDANDRIVSRTETNTVRRRGDATTADNGTGSGSVVVPVPAGLQAGDVLLAHVVAEGPSTTVTAPAGWTVVNRGNNGAVESVVLWRAVQPGDPTSHTFTLSASVSAVAGMASYAGVDVDVPIDAASVDAATTASTSAVAKSVTTTVADAKLVALHGLPAAVATTPASGMAETWDGAGAAVASEAAEESVATVGATGDRPGTTAAATAAVSHLVALTPLVTITRYGFSADGDTPDLTMDDTNVVTERALGLSGGVILTQRAGGDVWSYPNLHGDVVVTADANGAKTGGTFVYDPFGNRINGSDLPDNLGSNVDWGWLGGHQRGMEHAGSLGVIEMGARQYVPGLGRFLEVDPVHGGSANDYEYCLADPINCFDLDGLWGFKLKNFWKAVAAVAVVVAVVAVAVALAPVTVTAVAIAGVGAVGIGISGVSTGALAVAAGATAVAVGASHMADRAPRARSPKARAKGKAKAQSSTKAARTKNMGRRYNSRKVAERAAQRDARRMKRACYRGTCSSRDHVHVDIRNAKGKIITTRHYRWLGR